MAKTISEALFEASKKAATLKSLKDLALEKKVKVLNLSPNQREAESLKAASLGLVAGLRGAGPIALNHLKARNLNAKDQPYEALDEITSPYPNPSPVAYEDFFGRSVGKAPALGYMYGTGKTLNMKKCPTCGVRYDATSIVQAKAHEGDHL
jgi:hypothetical protein